VRECTIPARLLAHLFHQPMHAARPAASPWACKAAQVDGFRTRMRTPATLAVLG